MIFLGHLSTAAFKLARAPNLIRWMSSTSKARRWKGRTFDLVGACRQCPARPTSKPYAHIVVQHPVSHQLFAFSSLLELNDRSIHFYGPHLACGISWSGVLGPFRELFRWLRCSCDRRGDRCSCVAHSHVFQTGWLRLRWDWDEGPSLFWFVSSFGRCVQCQCLAWRIGYSWKYREQAYWAGAGLVSDSGSAQVVAPWGTEVEGSLAVRCSRQHLWTGCPALAVVTQHAYSGHTSKLDDRALLALKLHVKLLEFTRPRELRRARPASNAIWFIPTDASFRSSDDSTFAGIGAVLFDPPRKPLKFFSKQLPSSMIHVLNPAGKKSAIYEREFFALFCSFLVWGKDLSGVVVIYTDNNAVRDSSGHTTNVLARRILIATLGLECEHQLTPWYARGPHGLELGRWAVALEVGTCLTTWCLRVWHWCLAMLGCTVGLCWKMGRRTGHSCIPSLQKGVSAFVTAWSPQHFASTQIGMWHLHSLQLHVALDHQRFQDP